MAGAEAMAVLAALAVSVALAALAACLIWIRLLGLVVPYREIMVGRVAMLVLAATVDRVALVEVVAYPEEALPSVLVAVAVVTVVALVITVILAMLAETATTEMATAAEAVTAAGAALTAPLESMAKPMWQILVFSSGNQAFPATLIIL